MDCRTQPHVAFGDNLNSLWSYGVDVSNRQPCGLCQKAGAEVVWSTSYSYGAHTYCFKVIESAESPLIKTIHSLFPGKTELMLDAHSIAIEAVTVETGPILDYLSAHSESALADLFDTVGIKAAIEFSKRLERKRKRIQ
ncbi:MAG: hypothetical protein WCF65_02245 [Parachlamydiaceae bacterium]